MKKDVYGTRTLARKYGVGRDVIRDMIDRRHINPSNIKRGKVFCFVFDGKAQKIIEARINKKKKTV